MTVVAYVLVLLPISSFVLMFAMWVIGMPIALALAWAPEKLRMAVSMPISAFGGMLVAVGYGFGVFQVLVGEESFTWAPFAAASLPLLYAIYQDFHKWAEVKLQADAMTDDLQRLTSGLRLGPYLMPRFELPGLLASYFLYVHPDGFIYKYLC